MTFLALPCPCGRAACQSWHVSPVAAIQGVSFTESQARAVAALLNRPELIKELVGEPELTSERFDKTPCSLYNAKGEVMFSGVSLRDKDGEVYILKGGAAPHKPDSSGYVFLEDRQGNDYCFYPSVFDLRWLPSDETRRNFEVWLDIIDRILYQEIGLSHLDLPDYTWRDYFDSNLSPRDAVFAYAIDSDEPLLASLLVGDSDE